MSKKNEATYTGLVSQHNGTICKQFQRTKDSYREDLTKIVAELEECLNKLEKPNNYQIAPKEESKKNKKKKDQNVTEG